MRQPTDVVTDACARWKANLVDLTGDNPLLTRYRQGVLDDGLVRQAQAAIVGLVPDFAGEAAQSLAKRLPTLAQVEDWIAQADAIAASDGPRAPR